MWVTNFTLRPFWHHWEKLSKKVSYASVTPNVSLTQAQNYLMAFSKIKVCPKHVNTLKGVLLIKHRKSFKHSVIDYVHYSLTHIPACEICLDLCYVILYSMIKLYTLYVKNFLLTWKSVSNKRIKIQFCLYLHLYLNICMYTINFIFRNFTFRRTT